MTDDFEKLNIGDIDDWNPGDALEARKWQQIVEILRSLGLANLPVQNENFNTVFQVRLMKVIRLEKDVIICNFSDGVVDIAESDEDEITVAMPYELRKTPFDSAEDPAPRLWDGKFKYTFTFARDGEPRFDKRTSIDTTDDDDEEIQVITQVYDPGTLIWAQRGMFSATAVFHDEEKTQPVVWLDQNIASRAWALSDEDDDEEIA